MWSRRLEEFPKRNRQMKYNSRLVARRTHLVEARKAFLTSSMALTRIQYNDEIIRFGMELSPDSYPFRELEFALVFNASSQATFHSFTVQLSRVSIFFEVVNQD